MRFFQWVDEHGHYNSKSILARLITRPNRIIRDDATETALDQAELEELDKMSIVRVKWFVQPHYRLPARILPRFHVEHECHFIKLVKRLDLGDGNVDKKREIIARIRRRPHHFQSRCRERLAQLEQRERLKSSEIEAEEARLAAECRALEKG